MTKQHEVSIKSSAGRYNRDHEFPCFGRFEGNFEFFLFIMYAVNVVLWVRYRPNSNLLREPLYHVCEFALAICLPIALVFSSHVGMLKLPAFSCAGVDYQEDDLALIQKRADIAHSVAVLLEKGQLKYSRQSGRFTGMELGRIASYLLCDVQLDDGV